MLKNCCKALAIISREFPDNADLDEMTEQYFKSSEFAENAAGFDRSKFINVETKILRSAKLT